ncbi:MAG TPA: phosphate signaling complex protein PhoU [Steroidobacteraceae bacterium]|jgi:phosphate transport system protein|nr:phosphate signaling complex protein PhoU [Steroidobacteraceae bacterium]
MLEGHISRSFDGELAGLHIRVLEMGGLALDQVRAAARAYAEWDLHNAQLAIDREGVLITSGSRIFDDQLTLIARRNPVASDLRAIIALAKIAAELDRAGAEACKIARTVLHQSGRPGRRTSSDARHLANLATALLRLSLEALDQLDSEIADQVIDHDQDLDAEYAAGLRRLLTRALEDPANLEVTVEAAFVLKALERIGDHARNAAQQIVSLADHVAVGGQAAQQ